MLTGWDAKETELKSHGRCERTYIHNLIGLRDHHSFENHPFIPYLLTTVSITNEGIDTEY